MKVRQHHKRILKSIAKSKAYYWSIQKFWRKLDNIYANFSDKVGKIIMEKRNHALRNP